MTQPQALALTIAAVWLFAVAIRFRKSTPVLVGGLVLVSAFALAAILLRQAPAGAFGLAPPQSWPETVALAAGWTVLMLAFSPAADWVASQFFAKPPTLQAFSAIQQSTAKLIAGIAIAWLLGAFLEELVFRGVVQTGLEALLGGLLSPSAASGFALLAAALGAGLCHYYQGPRAMVIITQLSMLFGVLYVVSGYNLWAVILAHGFYDTIAFIRFATKRSKYSDLGQASPSA